MDCHERKQEYPVHLLPPHLQLPNNKRPQNPNQLPVNKITQKSTKPRSFIRPPELSHENINRDVNNFSDKIHRLTPEIVEPRISAFESETVLRKKVKPVCQNGSPHLPSIDSFRTSIDNNNISPTKYNAAVVETTESPMRIANIKDRSLEEIHITDSDTSPTKSPYKTKSGQNTPIKQKIRKGPKRTPKIERQSCGCNGM